MTFQSAALPANAGNSMLWRQPASRGVETCRMGHVLNSFAYTSCTTSCAEHGPHLSSEAPSAQTPGPGLARPVGPPEHRPHAVPAGGTYWPGHQQQDQLPTQLQAHCDWCSLVGAPQTGSCLPEPAQRQASWRWLGCWLAWSSHRPRVKVALLGAAPALDAPQAPQQCGGQDVRSCAKQRAAHISQVQGTESAAGGQ